MPVLFCRHVRNVNLAEQLGNYMANRSATTILPTCRAATVRKDILLQSGRFPVSCPSGFSIQSFTVSLAVLRDDTAMSGAPRRAKCAKTLSQISHQSVQALESGRYTTGIDFATCLDCGLGDMASCSMCPEGWYRPSSSTDPSTCLKCGIGYKASMKGQIQCDVCDGVFGDGMGLISCKACTINTYQGAKLSKAANVVRDTW